MKRLSIHILVFSIFLSILAGFVLALDQVESMRCGSKLVRIGDTKVDVAAKCGEPVMRDKVVQSSSVKKSGKKSGTSGKKVQERSRVDEQWVYDLGPRDFAYTLYFEGVELKSIGRGGRGARR
jgi:hypothetical protein